MRRLLPVLRVGGRLCSSWREVAGVKADALATLSQEELSELPASVRASPSSSSPQSVAVLQPYIKWGPLKKTNLPAELLLGEARSLVASLNGSTLVSSSTFNLLSFQKNTFFPPGQLERVKDIVQKSRATALFLNVSSLRVEQQLYLERYLGVAVWDRYAVVVSIFKERALTKEAQLLVSLAEIGHLRRCFLKDAKEGSSESPLKKRLHFLEEGERKLKRELEVVRKRRGLLRSKRKENGVPLIAVVGYTNVGKTSLIKRLTGDASLQPRDELFATLDVTTHSAHLPRNLKVLLADTIGFITDLPSDLLEPFVATLEEVGEADVIVHVVDVSHPQVVSQHSHVVKTLDRVVSKGGQRVVVTVGNKKDLWKGEESPPPPLPHAPDPFLLVSSRTGEGLEQLANLLSDLIVTSPARLSLRVRVLNGGPEYSWLLKEAAVSSSQPDPTDYQYIFLNLSITKPALFQFKRLFLSS